MIIINLSTSILRPIEQVFDFVVNPGNNVSWQYGSLASAQKSEQIGIGSIFYCVGHFMGRRFEGDFEVTEYEPNKKYGYRSVLTNMQLHTLYAFNAVHGGTLVITSTQANTHGLFKLADPIVAKYAKKLFNENLVKLKSLLETS